VTVVETYHVGVTLLNSAAKRCRTIHRWRRSRQEISTMTTPCASFASRPCSADLDSADLCSADPSTSSGNVSRRSLGAGRASVSRWERIARRGLAVSLLVLVVLGAALPSWATTFTVTDTSDNATDANSLRYAVNNAASDDTVNFNLTYPATIALTCTNGPLVISTNVTISGPGAANLAISGNYTGPAA
jgi:hypothetical protein